ncbi:hypothetical protein [Taibaiella soli]|uniref:Uncharacterized protein n=1 Tax=Taibaiella soli TaxID=1649169 RepID=A0A2W2AV34_9BACT|nr:hypothetical protein [Taibaiella soli]PZF71814.1 hypothetical protein DN068_17265 [Taibaiella soli]
MKPVRAYQETYGKKYGIVMLVANLFFLLLLIANMVVRYEEDAHFPVVPAVVLAIFLLQVYFRNKQPNAIIGVVGLIYAGMAFFNDNTKNLLESVAVVSPKVEMLLIMIMSGILIGGYFTHADT